MKTLRTFAQSERRRLFVAVLLVAVVVIAAVVIFTIRTAERQLTEDIDRSLQREVHDARAVIALLDWRELDQLRRVSMVGSRKHAVLALSSDGSITYSAPSGTDAKPDPLPDLPSAEVLRRGAGDLFTASDANGRVRYRVATTHLPGDRVLAFATPLTSVDHAIADVQRQALLAGSAAVALLIVATALALRAARRPLDTMSDVADRIREGDLGARVPEPALRGDALRLGTTLNETVAALESQFARREAEEARLRQFIADASHELRTPLTHVRGYSELIGRREDLDPEIRLFVTRIENEAIRMTQLVDDLLLLARLDAGRSLEPEVSDVAVIVNEVVDDFQRLEPTRRVKLTGCDEPIIADVDQRRLRQVFTNVVTNVRMHTPPATTLDVEVSTDTSSVVIEFRDDGPGMEPTVAARVFDRFYRADVSRNRGNGGTGLGLPIASAIVLAHRGTMRLDIRDGGGTSVVIRLPAAPVPVQPPSRAR